MIFLKVSGQTQLPGIWFYLSTIFIDWQVALYKWHKDMNNVIPIIRYGIQEIITPLLKYIKDNRFYIFYILTSQTAPSIF